MTLLDVILRGKMEWVGSAAAVCTTVSFLPQVIHVWRRKSASDISLMMFSLFSVGLFLWLVYGLGIGSMPIVVANVITLTLALTILALKLRYDGKQRTGIRE
jgi:MtN3 and saliva related transmembrane protein